LESVPLITGVTVTTLSKAIESSATSSKIVIDHFQMAGRPTPTNSADDGDLG